MKNLATYSTMLKVYARAHKITAGVGIIVVLLGGYWGYGKLTSTAGEIRYVTASAQKDTIVSSITGTGQVSVSNQVDLKPKVSADVTYVGVVNGQQVKAGTLIAQFDARDALKAVRDAQASLDSAKLSLQKIQQPADELSTTQAENSLARAQESKQNTQADLVKAYGDGFTTVSNTFLDLPGVMAGLQDVLFTAYYGSGASGQSNMDYYAGAVTGDDDKNTAIQFRNDAYNAYESARTAYDKNFADYKTLSLSSDPEQIDAVIAETYTTTANIGDAVKDANNLIQFYKDKLTQQNFKPIPLADTHLASLNTYTAKTNTHVADLLGAKNTILNDKDALKNADRTIDESTQSLAKLKSGSDPLDIQSSQLSLKERQNALLDAQEKLADYAIRAPFDGTIAKINVKKADSASSGTVVATLITKQQVAELSLNEVDVAKVHVGQKSTLTFDAVDGLGMTGVVAEIDSVGTVSQGVVTYAVKISFDTQDDRVKPGMSVSAAIITDVKQDVLTVPNGAVKSQGGAFYVEIFDQPLAQSDTSQGAVSPIAPRRQPVMIGVSNDTVTEITSGLKEGDQVVVRTITATVATTSTAPSLFGGATGGSRGAGAGGGFGGGVRGGTPAGR